MIDQDTLDELLEEYEDEGIMRSDIFREPYDERIIIGDYTIRKILYETSIYKFKTYVKKRNEEDLGRF